MPSGTPRKACGTPPAAQARGADPIRLPKYVRSCQNGDWHLHLHRFNPLTGECAGSFRAPYKCRSWRHPGPCRRWRAAQNFSRTNQALLHYEVKELSFLVFTLKPSQWRSRYQAFEELKERWRALAKAIRRVWGGFGYISTVEVHRSGWPHLNVIVANRLFGESIGNRKGIQWLKRHAVLCGFGPMLSAERAVSRRALAGYVVKVAGSVETAAAPGAGGNLVGEVVKLSQLPENAPRHFRRLRSSVGFLPKPYKNPEVTGELVRARMPENPEAENPEANARRAQVLGPNLFHFLNGKTSEPYREPYADLPPDWAPDPPEQSPQRELAGLGLGE